MTRDVRVTTTVSAAMTTAIPTTWLMVTSSSMNTAAEAAANTGMASVITDTTTSGTRAWAQLMRKWPTAPFTTAMITMSIQPSVVGTASRSPLKSTNGVTTTAATTERPARYSKLPSSTRARFDATKYHV